MSHGKRTEISYNFDLERMRDVVEDLGSEVVAELTGPITPEQVQQQLEQVWVGLHEVVKH